MNCGTLYHVGCHVPTFGNFDRAATARSRYSVVAVGASAGGLRSLQVLLSPLPADFPCGILIVLHLSKNHRSMLADVLGRSTALVVHDAADGQTIRSGCVYVAPPNQHLLAEAGNVRLVQTPEVHHLRPSVDLLFESVAASYGTRAVAIILSGTGNDGASGIRAVKQAGGTTMAEDPTTAMFNAMPCAAIASGCVDLVMPMDKIGETLIQLIK